MSAYRRGQDRTNPFTAAWSDNMAMRPFAKLPWTLVLYCRLGVLVPEGRRSRFSESRNSL